MIGEFKQKKMPRRKQPNIIGIYKVTNPNGEIYIGQTRNFRRRRHSHRCSIPFRSTPLYISFKAHGFDAHTFQMLHQLPNDISKEILNEYERVYIKAHEGKYKMLNVREGGTDGKISPETRAKISMANKGNKTRLGYKHTEETKRKIGESNRIALLKYQAAKRRERAEI